MLFQDDFDPIGLSTNLGLTKGILVIMTKKAIQVLRCSNRLHHVILDVSVAPQRKDNIFGIFGVQHVWTNVVITQIRFRNHIGPFGLITCTHGSTYQIMGSKFGYGLEMCQAPKTAWLVGRPPLCVVRLYLIKEFIKRALILNLNIHHALKEITHITCQKHITI